MKDTKRFKHYFILPLVMLLLFACRYKSDSAGSNALTEKTINNSYATGFQIRKIRGGELLIIGHPNDHKRPFQKIALYKDKPVKNDISCDFQIKVPLKRIAAMSVTHIGFLDAVNSSGTLIGVTDPFRIYNKSIQEGLKRSDIENLGGSMVPDVEQIFALHPEAVFMSGFPNTKEKNKVIEEAGIPVVYTVAWTETSPLARAEWIKFFGHLFGQEELADSVFKAVEKNYLSLSKMADSLDQTPDVFCGNSFKGVWYLPGGNSYVSNLIDDAGGNYIFKNDTTSGSMAVSFEVVYKEARNATYWLNVQEKSITEMLGKDSRYKDFKPVQLQNVYNRQASGILNGGNDYFETGSWRPDLVLSDLIYILHPEIKTEQLNFYKRLPE